MLIHHFDAETGVHLASSEAQPNPLEHALAAREKREVTEGEAWLIPAHATPIAPPAAPDGHAAVFDRSAGVWSVQPADAAIEAAANAKPDKAVLWALFRARREHFLFTTDWTQAAVDAPLTPDQRAAFAAQRKTLRDLPAVEKDPAKALAQLDQITGGA